MEKAHFSSKNLGNQSRQVRHWLTSKQLHYHHVIDVEAVLSISDSGVDGGEKKNPIKLKKFTKIYIKSQFSDIFEKNMLFNIFYLFKISFLFLFLKS